MRFILGDSGVIITETGLVAARLALWTRHSAANGRELGKRLRILKWEDAADRGRLSR